MELERLAINSNQHCRCYFRKVSLLPIFPRQTQVICKHGFKNFRMNLTVKEYIILLRRNYTADIYVYIKESDHFIV